jgi:hypothetical protein
MAAARRLGAFLAVVARRRTMTCAILSGRAPGEGGAVKYLLLIYNNPVQPETADIDTLMRGHATLYRELAEAGTVVSSAALSAPPAVTTVRVREGAAPAITDGPYLEAKEYLAGYYLVDCATREEALEIAARIPCGAAGAVEVRPVDEEVTRVVQGEDR